MKRTSTAARLAYIVRAGTQTLRTRDFGATLATLQDGLDHQAFERLAAVMRADPDGRWLLQHRPRISSRTLDERYLRSLPEETLGGAFLRHLSDNNLLQDVEIPPSPFPLSDEAEYAKARWRETHDFRHVLTGLGISIRDEIVLQAFQLGQIPNWFARVQMTAGPILAPCNPAALVRSYLRAWRAGRQALPLACVRWEELWEVPVVSLREKLRVGVLR